MSAETKALELSQQEMESWGIEFAREQTRPCIITLNGDLGAGKTTLARALCRGFGVIDIDSVTSPTFAILQEYAATGFTVTHVDFYRLRNEAELDALGWDEIVDAAQVLIVEWPERTDRPWPSGTIHLQLGYAGPELTSRTVTVSRGT